MQLIYKSINFSRPDQKVLVKSPEVWYQEDVNKVLMRNVYFDSFFILILGIACFYKSDTCLFKATNIPLSMVNPVSTPPSISL